METCRRTPAPHMPWPSCMTAHQSFCGLIIQAGAESLGRTPGTSLAINITVQLYLACASGMSTPHDLCVGGRTCARMDVRGRISLQLHAIMLTMLILRGTARYCVQLQQKSRNTRQNRAELDLCVRGRACTCLAAIIM